MRLCGRSVDQSSTVIQIRMQGLSSSDQSSFLYLPEENAYFLYLPEENESQWRDFCAALNREDCPEDRGFFLVTLISCGHLSQVRLDLSRGTTTAPGIWVTVSRFFIQVTAAPRGWWVHLSFHCLIFLGVSSVCQTF